MTTPIEGEDYFVRYMELPPRIHAFVHLNNDGTYSIFLDPRRTIEQQRESYIHELRHIVRGDMFDSTRTVSEIEHEM